MSARHAENDIVIQIWSINIHVKVENPVTDVVLVFTLIFKNSELALKILYKRSTNNEGFLSLALEVQLAHFIQYDILKELFPVVGM